MLPRSKQLATLKNMKSNHDVGDLQVGAVVRVRYYASLISILVTDGRWGRELSVLPLNLRPAYFA